MRSMRAEPITRSAGIIFINGETLGRMSHKMPAFLQAPTRNGFGGFPIRNRTMRVTHTEWQTAIDVEEAARDCGDKWVADAAARVISAYLAGNHADQLSRDIVAEFAFVVNET
jgi:hypothetical protein